LLPVPDFPYSFLSLIFLIVWVVPILQNGSDVWLRRCSC
jgi:hypothetical protein